MAGVFLSCMAWRKRSHQLQHLHSLALLCIKMLTSRWVRCDTTQQFKLFDRVMHTGTASYAFVDVNVFWRFVIIGFVRKWFLISVSNRMRTICWIKIAHTHAPHKFKLNMEIFVFLLIHSFCRKMLDFYDCECNRFRWHISPPFHSHGTHVIARDSLLFRKHRKLVVKQS